MTPARSWKARGAFLEAIKNSTTDMDECDIVVPRNKIADFSREEFLDMMIRGRNEYSKAEMFTTI